MQDIDLTDREQREVEFALEYYEKFNHGTPGHTHLVLIAKLVKQLDSATFKLNAAKDGLRYANIKFMD